MMLILETKRLIMRPFEDADLETFYTYRNDPEVARYQGWEMPFTREKVTEFMEEMHRSQPGNPGDWYQLALIRKDQPGLIGDVAFHTLVYPPHQAEIGFTLSIPFQGQGYAAEAVTRLLAYLFEELHFHRVIGTCDVDNPASAHLMERVGMRREAHFIEHIWYKGAWSSEYLYAILEREWAERSKKLTG